MVARIHASEDAVVGIDLGSGTGPVALLLVLPVIGLTTALAFTLARRRPHLGLRADPPDPVAPVALAERIGVRARATAVVADPGKAAWRRALR